MISHKLKLTFLIVSILVVGYLMYLIKINARTLINNTNQKPMSNPSIITPPPSTSLPASTTTPPQMSELEAHIKNRMLAMQNTSCNYSLNLSKSNKILWKACDDGYNRYYIPQNVWFNNNLPNQSPEDESMCIGKAIKEIRKTHPDYSYDINENSEYDLWFAEEC